MSTKESIEKIINKKFKELQEYTSTFSKKAESNREELITKYKPEFMKDNSKVDIKDLARDMFYMNGFFQADIRLLQTELLNIYNFSKELFPELEFNSELEEVIKVLKVNLNKQLYVINEGTFEEIEEGTTEKLKKNFDKNNYFSMFENKIKTLLNA